MSECILALDTATESVSAALLREGRVTFRIERERNRHSERIIPLADELLKEAGIRLADVDAVAFGAGPGAFTGLRVACGVAQGFAWALGLPVVPVSNLQALALAAMKEGKTAGRLIAAVDARMGECYAAAFDVASGFPEPLSGPELVKPGDVAALAGQFGAGLVAGSAVAACGEKMNLPAGIAAEGSLAADASHIALAACELFRRGVTVPAALAAPLYVRNRVALTIEERAALREGKDRA